MDQQNRSFEEMLREAVRHEPVVTLDEIDRALEARIPGIVRRQRFHQALRYAGIAAAIATVIGLFLLLSNLAGSKPGSGGGQSRQSATASHSTISTQPVAPRMTDSVATYEPIASSTPSTADAPRQHAPLHITTDDVSRRPHAGSANKASNRGAAAKATFVPEPAGQGYIDLDEEQAAKLGVTFNDNGDILFGYAYLLKDKPTVAGPMLQAMPFSEAYRNGTRDSGLITLISTSGVEVRKRPVSEFRPGPIATAWRYVSDGHGYKMAQRYAPDPDNMRYSLNGVDYTWQQDRPINETKLDAQRRAAFQRTWGDMTSQQFDREINSWLPLRITRRNALNSASSHVIIWTVPTLELMAALPQGELNNIRWELLAFMSAQSGENSVTDSVQTWALGMLDRMVALGMPKRIEKVDPWNVQFSRYLFGKRWGTLAPVELQGSELTMLTDALRWQARSFPKVTLAAKLLYYEGTSIADLAKDEHLTDDPRSLVIRLPKNIPSGIYQIQLTTDRGRPATWRVLVER